MREDPVKQNAAPPAPTGHISPRLLGWKELAFLALLGFAAIGFALYNVVGVVDREGVDLRYAPQDQVNLEGPRAPVGGKAAQPVASRLALRVAVAPVISPEKSLEMYNAFVQYLAKKVNREPVYLQRQTYAETNHLVRYRRCDIAIVCAYPFVLGEREFGMQALVVPQVNGVVTYHSLILVPKTSQAASLLDLRGKRFASADIISNSGWLFPVSWLKSRGEDPDHFFAQHVITGSHDRSVKAVATGYVDGAAVDNLVYEQMAQEDPALSEKTKIITKSPPFGMNPLVVHPQIDVTLKNQLLRVLLGMHEDPEGRQVLAPLRIERFVAPEDGLFDGVRAAAKILEARP